MEDEIIEIEQKEQVITAYAVKNYGAENESVPVTIGVWNDIDEIRLNTGVLGDDVTITFEWINIDDV